MAIFAAIHLRLSTPPVVVSALSLAIFAIIPRATAMDGPDLPPHVEIPIVSSITPEALTPVETADLHMARKRYQAAIQIYSQLPVKSAEVWNKLGIANQQMLIVAEARSYEMSLKLNPKNPDVWNNLGSLYYSQKDYGSAERYYRKALKLSPKSSLIYKNLGTAMLAENKVKKGWQCYQTALTLDPQIFERSSQYRVGGPTASQTRGAMNYFLAVSYLHVGKMDRAVDYLRMAIDQGYTDRKKAMVDKEFSSMHSFTPFLQLVSEEQRQ